MALSMAFSHNFVMSDSGKKLRTLRERRRLSQSDLSQLTGIEQATISRIENGQKVLISPHVQKLADALREPVSSVLGFESNVVPAPLGARKIPVIDWVQAGHFAGVAPYFRDEEEGNFAVTDMSHSKETFAMKVRGDSMEPEFREGDMIVIDPEVSPGPGDFCIAKDEGGLATFKQYRDAGKNAKGQDVFELVPLNPLYGPMRSDRQPLKIVGTMMEHHRYRRQRRS